MRDTVQGTNGSDTLSGTSADELFNGMNGDDFITGGAGSDVLYGHQGDDNLSGGSGNDFIHGEFGDDTISGGSGTDYTTGGQGNDVFIFNDNSDFMQIGDFTVGEDIIQFNGAGTFTLLGLTDVGTFGVDLEFETSDGGTEILRLKGHSAADINQSDFFSLAGSGTVDFDSLIPFT